MDSLAGSSSSTSAIRSPSPDPSSTGSRISRRLSWNRSMEQAESLDHDPARRLSVVSLSHPMDSYDPGSTRPSTHVHQPYRYDFAASSDSSIDDPSSTSPSGHVDGGPSSSSRDDLERLTSRSGQDGYGLEAGYGTPRSARQREYGDDGQIRTPGSSPLRFASNIARSPTVKAVSSRFRRASVRVVNIMGGDSGEKGVRIEGGDGEEHELDSMTDEPLDFDSAPEPERPAPRPPEGLVGKTLGVLGPDNRVRQAMYALLQFRFTEQAILVLIILNVIVLSFQGSKELNTPRPNTGYFQAWEDYVLFVLFVIFTLEMAARIIVSGLILDPRIRTTDLTGPDPTLRHVPTNFLQRAQSVWRRFIQAVTQHSTAAADSSVALSDVDASTQPKDATFMSQAWRSADDYQNRGQDSGSHTPRRQGTMASIFPEVPFETAVQRQQSLAVQGRPYLRHSWHRVDLVAVVCFWITFILAITRLEAQDGHHLYVFRALSVLRAARLLVITSGTMTILHSLKRAAPLLIRVSAFVIFALILFSIIGVQAFRGSFRRICMYTDPHNATNIFSTEQSCGGYVNPLDLSVVSFIDARGFTSDLNPKGYICPLGQTCILSNSNPHENSQSFDHIFAAAMQVIVIASVNTWAPIMYLAMDSEYFASCLFFICGVIVLNFWLFNLFVAVVINTFKAIREETKRSAFSAVPLKSAAKAVKDAWAGSKASNRRWPNWIRSFHDKTRLAWVLLVLIDLVTQATKTANTSPSMLKVMSDLELAFTIAFDVEIVIRFMAYFPDWRHFFHGSSNNFDLFLAVATSIIQIPNIRNGGIYPWLTVFQLLRWYRVVLVVPRMKPLLDTVFGGYAGLANMVTFLFLVNFIAALVAIQLFRGDIPADADNITFSQQYNSFLGMYQVFSSEDWTTILYTVVGNGYQYKQGVISAILICVWFLFANFIVLQLFIAVVNENFNIAEDAKRKRQMEAYIRRTEPVSAHVSWIDRLNPYRLLKAKPKTITVQNIPSSLVLPLQKAVLRDAEGSQSSLKDYDARNVPFSAKAAIWRLLGRETSELWHPVNLTRERATPDAKTITWDDDQGLTSLLPAASVGISSDEHADVRREMRNRQADFIAAHPGFDKTLWLFGPRHPLRRACQFCVPSAYGDRMYGRPPNPLAYFVLKTIVFLAVVGSIVIIAITTPSYRRSWIDKHGVESLTWYDITEMALGAVFITEFIIKVVADGFVFAPNAYLLSVWNVFDFVILVTILVNLTASIIYVGELSRFIRAIKGFRALRLITLFSRLRDTFHVVVVAGALRILDASVLMVLYIIPFAVWGLNIFSGLLYSCNDSKAPGKADCFGVFDNSPLNDSLLFLTPRVWSNPGMLDSTWAFDSFRQAILILFEIVSLEGWIDVLFSVMDIRGRDRQPEQNVAQWNGIYLVIYHLFGGVIILTLFVSIIIEAFNTRSGNALLTSEQRQWVDLSKFIRRQRPSRLPRHRPSYPLQAWCYDRAVNKHGFWAKGFTFLYCIHILFLMLLDFENTVFSDKSFNAVFLIFTIIYAVDLLVRFYGLGLRSFRSNGWNIFDVIVVTGSFATTIPAIQAQTAGVPPNQVNGQLQRLFLVSVSLKLVQRNSALNQLFKTSVASLPAIGNLFLLWGAIFIFFAILYIEVFGLTKLGNANGSRFQNYSTMGNALIMLAFMSVGEGWNGYMHDYAIRPPRCTQGSNFLYSDCGSPSWAFGLFISWNIISMYIFVNMFTGVVVESFAYVYQMPGGSSLNREDIRAFKKVWAEFDDDRTGYMPRKKFVPFFRKLTGALELRPYPSQFSVHSLLGRAAVADRVQDKRHTIESARHVIDVSTLNAELSKVDYALVRKRRQTFARVFYEAKLSEERGKGISFTAMLRMLAHHKLIDDDRALQLDELLARKTKTEKVADLVNVDRVRSLLLSIYLRRRYLRSRAEHRRTLKPEFGDIPAIVLEPHFASEPEDVDITSNQGQPASLDGLSSPLGSPTISLSGSASSAVQGHSLSPHVGFPAESSSTREHARKASDLSMLSAVSFDRDSVSSDGADQEDILSAMSTSMWGDMLREANNDDDDDTK